MKSSLKKVTKVVRGKHGTVRRSYYMKADTPVGSAGDFLKRHAGTYTKMNLRTGVVAGTAGYLGAYHAHKTGGDMAKQWLVGHFGGMGATSVYNIHQAMHDARARAMAEDYHRLTRWQKTKVDLVGAGIILAGTAGSTAALHAGRKRLERR